MQQENAPELREQFRGEVADCLLAEFLALAFRERPGHRYPEILGAAMSYRKMKWMVPAQPVEG